VTARRLDGVPDGVTVNSFNSVSLEPPMVLWSLAKSARCRAAFSASRTWAVHVLSAAQQSLAARFASRIADKFEGLELEEGVGGVPLLSGCVARLQCRTAAEYEGGDHIILVGEVIAFDRTDAMPLLFHGGGYALAVRQGDARLRDAEEPER
jgi:3-hydroxy-9,10-secoandrosta-1,3,5(10)-triene-9,17-dione monooxygenase reductase component